MVFFRMGNLSEWWALIPLFTAATFKIELATVRNDHCGQVAGGNFNQHCWSEKMEKIVLPLATTKTIIMQK